MLAQGEEERVLDSRPSDAVALALMAGARITVAESVLQRGGAGSVATDAEREHMWEKAIAYSPDQFNSDLQELCGSLQQLTDEALTRIVREAGVGTVAVALAPMLVKTEEEKGARMIRIGGVHTTHRPESRKTLPEELGRAIASIWERLERTGISLDEEAMPQKYGFDEAAQARKAIREAIGKLPGPQ